MKTTRTGFFLFLGLKAFSQVWINTSSPSATLDILSKNNTSATKALKINNLSNIEMLTVLDNGNVEIGFPNPDANLEVVGRVDFPTVATTNVVGPYNAMGINATKGQLGKFTPGSQPTYIVSSNVATASLNGNTFGSRGIDFGNIFSINTIGITYGTENASTIEDYNNGNSGNVTNFTPFYYYQIPQAGLYEFNVTGTIRCTTAYTDSGSYLTNMTIWKASTGSSTYAIQDDYRVLNITPDGGRFGYPVNQSFVLDLQAGDKISFRQYRAGSTGTWTDCQYTLPTNGAQKDSQRLTIIKL